MYNAYQPAVPREVIQANFNKIAQRSLHPKRQGHSVRREMTERKISDNIMQFNSAIISPDTSELFIG